MRKTRRSARTMAMMDTTITTNTIMIVKIIFVGTQKKGKTSLLLKTT